MRKMTNLEKLDVITPKLGALDSLVEDHGRGIIKYRITNGECIAIGLLYEPAAVAVENAFMTGDSIFPSMPHDETEILIVYKGSIHVKLNDDLPVLVGVGECIRIPPGTIHEVTALEHTWMIGVTVPASPGYARDGR